MCISARASTNYCCPAASSWRSVIGLLIILQLINEQILFPFLSDPPTRVLGSVQLINLESYHTQSFPRRHCREILFLVKGLVPGFTHCNAFGKELQSWDHVLISFCSAVWSPENGMLYICDIGSDQCTSAKIMSYIDWPDPCLETSVSKLTLL